MTNQPSSQFKVILVYEDIKCGVLLPLNITHENLFRYVVKKFSIGDNKKLMLTYNIDSSIINIVDEQAVHDFIQVVLKLGAEVMSVLIKAFDATGFKRLTFDLNIRLSKSPVTSDGKKNILTNTPPTPNAPTLDIQNLFPMRKAGQFDKTTIFDDKEECMYLIWLKCITEGYEYVVNRSCSKRYGVECADIECQWFIFARSDKMDTHFRVTHINDNHTCSKTKLYPNHRNASARMLARLLIPKLKDIRRVYTAKDIMKDINLEYNIDVSYKRAWRAKQLALEFNLGDPFLSFNQLPYYCYNLKLVNEGTVTHIETNQEGRFKMVFIA